MGVRIAKYIADCGVASRRDAEKIIESGVVTVNGVVINTPVFFVDDDDVVNVNGKKIENKTETKLYMFHKPINTMTTTRDPMGRKTIYDVLGKEYKNLKYVGRLDYKTTGLLLLTNDGALARKLSLPESNIERTYIATVGNYTEHGLDIARRGATVDGIKYRPMKIDVIDENHLKVTVVEGKKNEVRIVLRHIKSPVRALHRIAYGGISLGNLGVGKINEIDKKTVDLILKSLLES